MNLRARISLAAATMALCAVGSAGIAQEPQPTPAAPAPPPAQTSVTVQRDITVTTTTLRGVAPITYRDLRELMEAKLIAMTGSHEAAWILQGMHSRIGSDDIKYARERMMRVWEWP